MSTAVLQQDQVATRSMPPACRTADIDGAVAVESWRVVLQATGDAAASADAIVRLRSGGDRLLVTGEAGTAEAALLRALESAKKITPGKSLELGGSLQDQFESQQAAANVAVEAIHQQGLVGRLAVLLNAHQVTGFTYRIDPDEQTALVAVSVHGGDAQVSRAAHRLRRVIGVVRVTARLAGESEETLLLL